MQQCGIKATKYLAVFAHPDDETWINGTLSKIARKGHPLTVVYATSGEAGSDRSGRGLTGDDLAAEREHEAQQALQALGVSNEPIFLHLPDGELTDITGLLSEQVETLINDTQADVVLTFGPGGVTGHPDHIAIGAATSLAFDRSATPTLLLNIAITEERAQGLSVIAAKYGISKQ